MVALIFHDELFTLLRRNSYFLKKL